MKRKKRATKWTASTGVLKTSVRDEGHAVQVDERQRKTHKASVSSEINKGWLVSSFDSLMTRSHQTTKNEGFSEDSLLPWVDRYSPQSQSNLAVHKKKVEEVQTWIQEHLQSDHKQRKFGNILILTGPPGAGKTATVKVLVKELRCHLQEWSNPIGQDAHHQPMASEDLPWEHGYYPQYKESQTKQFTNFIFRSDRYGMLQLSDSDPQPGRRKIILVEDIPNAFYRQPDTLWPILRKYHQTGRCPLVFIVSDSVRGNNSVTKLFPGHVQRELEVDVINFNPIATTNMTKALTKIITMESKQSKALLEHRKSMISDCVETSSGDIRSAIHTMQILCSNQHTTGKQPTLSGSCSIKASVNGTKGVKGTSKVDRNECELAGIGGKDGSLFLFRALGKILHCKRQKDDHEVAHEKLPDHLLSMERLPLVYCPEEVVENSCLSPEYFVLYLHQNYLDFCESVDQMLRASEYLSDSVTLQRSFESQDLLHWCGVSVACRGLMHSSRLSAKSEWRPLHKPKCLEVTKLAKDNVRMINQLFIEQNLAQAHVWQPVELQTEILPFLAKLDIPLESSEQIRFLQDISSFPRWPAVRQHMETLGKTDAGCLQVDSQIENSQQESVTHASRVQSSAADTIVLDEDNEAHEIGDFEDEDEW